VLGVLVAALAMSVLPAGNAAPVVPCGAALAAPGATVGGDVSKCLLNTSSVLAGEQASTAWQVAQVDAALTDIDAVVGTFSSELDVVLKAVLAAQTKLDAQASAVACLNDCIVMGSCTCVGDITAGSGPASPGPAPTGSSMTSVLGDDDPGPTLGTDDDITMPMQTLVLIVFMIAKLTEWRNAQRIRRWLRRRVACRARCVGARQLRLRNVHNVLLRHKLSWLTFGRRVFALTVQLVCAWPACSILPLGFVLPLACIAMPFVVVVFAVRMVIDVAIGVVIGVVIDIVNFVCVRCCSRLMVVDVDDLECRMTSSVLRQHQIFVRTMRKTVTLEVCGDDKVEALRGRVAEKIGAPLGNLRLLCGSKQLQDGHTLADYHIQKESTLHLMMRLRGGASDDEDSNEEDFTPNSKRARPSSPVYPPSDRGRDHGGAADVPATTATPAAAAAAAAAVPTDDVDAGREPSSAAAASNGASVASSSKKRKAMATVTITVDMKDVWRARFDKELKELMDDTNASRLSLRTQLEVDKIKSCVDDTRWQSHLEQLGSKHARARAYPMGPEWRSRYIIGANGQLVRSEHNKKGLKGKMVCSVEDLFDVMYDLHVVQCRHTGYQALYKSVKQKYDTSITERACRAFTLGCPVCHKHKSRQGPPKAGSNPIETHGFSERQQVDLIDLRSTDCERYKWLLVLQDHGTKYCRLLPLVDKSSLSIAFALRTIWSDIGAPSIIQTDNGREFSGLDQQAYPLTPVDNLEDVVKTIGQMCPGMKVVHGRPRHSQSQGSVERLNQVVQSRLFKCLQQHGSAYWPVFVPYVQWILNSTWHKGVKSTPYELVFGQPPSCGMSGLNLDPALVEEIYKKQCETDLLAALRDSQMTAALESITRGADDETETGPVMANAFHAGVLPEWTNASSGSGSGSSSTAASAAAAAAPEPEPEATLAHIDGAQAIMVRLTVLTLTVRISPARPRLADLIIPA
jgi:hypothetical protein